MSQREIAGYLLAPGSTLAVQDSRFQIEVSFRFACET